jgi:hypothetical protein
VTLEIAGACGTVEAVGAFFAVDIVARRLANMSFDEFGIASTTA